MVFKNNTVQYAAGTIASQRCLADAGFMGVIIPRKFQGLNFPTTIYIMMIEMVSRADASMMTLFGYQDVGEAIASLTDEKVAKQFLPDYCTGKKIGAMVLTESGGGSDLQAIQVKAKKNSSGEWCLTGIKQFISHGNGDVLLVLARSEEQSSGMFGLSLFVVEGGHKNNVHVNRVEKKMGLHGSPTCEIEFINSRAYLVGKQKFGLFHVVDILNHARFSVAAQALGIAQSAYNAAYSYAKQRQAFGQYIINIPAVTELILEMKVGLVSSRALLYEGAQCLDYRNKLHEHITRQKNNGSRPSTEEKLALKKIQKKLDLVSPLIKYIITELANKCCYMAQQVFGGAGYIQGYTVERCIRDVRITTIYEGTTQVLVGLALKHVLADALAADFDQIQDLPFSSDLKAIVDIINDDRKIFSSLIIQYQQLDDDYFQQSCAKDMTDSYGNLYASYLLLKFAHEDSSRIVILQKQVKTVQADLAGVVTRFANGFHKTKLDHEQLFE